MRNALLWFAFVAATVSCALASAWLIAGCVSDYRPPHDLGADEVPLGLEEPCVPYTTAVEVGPVKGVAVARSQVSEIVDCWICVWPFEACARFTLPPWPDGLAVGGVAGGWSWTWECYQGWAADSCWGDGAR